ncbi:MAG: L,D-transpeptidase family protein [Pseudobdellovibrionaceae bacterium]
MLLKILFIFSLAQAQFQSTNPLKNVIEKNDIIDIAYVTKTSTSATPLKTPLLMDGQSLRKFYAFNDFRPIWVDQNLQTTPLFLQLKSLLTEHASSHGMTSFNGMGYYKYWLEILNQYINTEGGQSVLSSGNWLGFEISATSALLNYVEDLYAGRFEPRDLDRDIYYKRKTVGTDQLESLMWSLKENQYSSGEELSLAVDKYFSPRSYMYAAMRSMLQKLQYFKDKNNFPELSDLSESLSFRSPVSSMAQKNILMHLRNRLSYLGYNIVPNYNVYAVQFDSDLDQAVRDFQMDLGLDPDGILSKGGKTYSVLKKSADFWLKKIYLNLERLRWLPQDLEDRHLQVNLASAEAKLLINRQSFYLSRAIVGQPHRRTPQMRQMLRKITFAPSWFVPQTIFIDKVNEIRKNITYLDKNKLTVRSRDGDQTLSPQSINWNLSIEELAQKIYLQQAPGQHNALGVVKFNLEWNSDDIYMHDTNDHTLFDSTNRHLSSGCVRLEEAQNWAHYFLQDQMDFETINNKMNNPWGGYKTEDVFINEEIPVYLIYQTAEISSQGRLRLFKDSYAMDDPLWDLINVKPQLIEKISSAKISSDPSSTYGSLKVNANPISKNQYFSSVTAVRCKAIDQCDSPVYFSVNESVRLPTGSYLLYFENSMYPGFLNISANQTYELPLYKVSVPTQFSDKSKYLIYRDFDSQLEKNKILFNFYWNKKTSSQLLSRGLMDGLYSADMVQRPWSLKNNLDICGRPSSELSAKARSLCAILSSAKDFMSLADFFVFDPPTLSKSASASYRGGFLQKILNPLGDITVVPHPRYFVTTPISKKEHAWVFAGNYIVQSASEPKNIQQVAVGADNSFIWLK